MQLVKTPESPTSYAAVPAEYRAPRRAPAVDGQPGELVMRNVTKRFTGSEGGTQTTLEDVSLTCRPGEFVVVVGPSGCGKSTLLNIAAGMCKADSGVVTLDGQPIDGPGPDRAMVFQDHGLFPWLTSAQNIEFGLKMAGVKKGERKDRVAEALEMVHLSHSGRKLVHELSGGMRQRVAIARALVMNPRVLLMDEPFAALDAQTRTLLHEQLQELWMRTNKTILFVTHSVGEAVRLADRIVMLHAHPGRIRKEIRVELGHPREFDTPDITSLIRMVRKEVEDSVSRQVKERETEDVWKPQTPGDLGPSVGDLGGGI